MVASALNLGPSATLTDGDLVKLPVGACLDSVHHKATPTAQKIAASATLNTGQKEYQSPPTIGQFSG